MLRQWWDEYGKFIGIGLMFIGAGFGGWKGWDYVRERHAVEAAEQYLMFADRLEAVLSADDPADVGGPPPELPLDDYADTPYLSFAYLRRAQYFVARGELAEAADDLRWVGENAVQRMVSKLAYVRLARVMVSLGEAENALQVLDENSFSESFVPLVEEVRGDALIKLNDASAALIAYRAAWEASRTKPEFLRMKLESLGHDVAASAGVP